MRELRGEFMYIDDVLGILAMFLFICIIILVLLLSVFFVATKKQTAKQVLDDKIKTLQVVEENRMKLLKQLIELFGNKNPQTDNLTKLVELFPKANTAERKEQWNGKYHAIISKFMKHAENNVSDQMKQAFELASMSLKNEDLSVASAEIDVAYYQSNYDKFLEPPLSFIANFGDIIANVFKKTNKIDTNYSDEDLFGLEPNNSERE